MSAEISVELPSIFESGICAGCHPVPSLVPSPADGSPTFDTHSSKGVLFFDVSHTPTQEGGGRTTRDAPMVDTMKGLFAPLPLPGAPLRSTISRGKLRLPSRSPCFSFRS